MSDYEAKSGIRAQIRSLKGKNRTEAYAYFRSILGDAAYIDEWQGEIEHFEFKGRFQPGQEYSYGKTENDRWFVDLVLYEGSPFEDDNEFYLTAARLVELTSEIKAKFSEVEDQDVMVFSYTWYNGADEPRIVVPPNSDD